MRLGALQEFETKDPASLDSFITSLIEAGFEPEGDSGAIWTGPIHKSLSQFTDSKYMRIEIRGGWPFLHPTTWVEGLPKGLHRTDAGYVCLWADGDPSLDWKTWSGISNRIEKWAEETQESRAAIDPIFDLHAFFRGVRGGLATIDLTDIEVSKGDIFDLRATRKDNQLKIGEGSVHGRMYLRGDAIPPPANIEDALSALSPEQLLDFNEYFKNISDQNQFFFIVWAWNLPTGLNLLILGLERDENGDHRIFVYEAARTDPEILKLRAGPDARALANKTVAVFGVGAIGSHIVDLLARSGLGNVEIHDPQILRPGDVVRHAGLSINVGQAKVTSVAVRASLSAPWTDVRVHADKLWSPKLLDSSIEGADLVIDATGLKTFTAQLSLLCRDRGTPIISAALYRQGDLGRVRVQQGVPTDLIYSRSGDSFPEIPSSSNDPEVIYETGCADPIAQAPPASVVSLAAMAVRHSIDMLTAQADRDIDIVEVYKPLEQPPFNQVGTLHFPKE